MPTVVVDRVFQQAITQVLSPIYEKQFSENSFGFRPKRGAHDALKQCQQNVNAFVEKIYFHPDGSLEIHLYYDDFLKQLVETAEERAGEADAGTVGTLHEAVGRG